MATRETPTRKSGTALGRGRPLPEVARKLVLPTGIVSTDWPKVHKICTQKLGAPLDSWQADAGRVILARRADGDLAAMVDGVGMSLPRQVGKTYLLAALIFALCILRPGLLVIWSAHHGKTHAETFLAMQAFAQRMKVAPYVEQVFVGSGDEEIRFVNGSRILFGARERGFGRGIPGVDVLVFDEAQILSDRALANMLATMNTSKFGLALYIGTPPKPEDNSESFKRMRTDAYAGRLTDGVWIEFGADPDADPDDRAQLAKANPSYPHRTPEKSIQRLKRKLTLEDFRREGLGIWDPDDGGSGALPYGKWLGWKDLEAERGDDVVFGVDITTDRTAWISAAWLRPDKTVQVTLTNKGSAFAAHGLADECKRLSDKWGATFYASPGVAEDLERAGVKVEQVKTGQFAAASGAFADAVTAGTVHHHNQPALNEAVKAARWRTAGTSGERAFKLADCPEVGPLAAATRALFGARSGEAYDVLDSIY